MKKLILIVSIIAILAFSGCVVEGVTDSTARNEAGKLVYDNSSNVGALKLIHSSGPCCESTPYTYVYKFVNETGNHTVRVYQGQDGKIWSAQIDDPGFMWLLNES